MGSVSSNLKRVRRSIQALTESINNNLSQVTNELVQTIRNVNQQVLPQVNKTLQDFQDVLKIAGEFLLKANLALKVLILFILLCAAFVCKKLFPGRREGLLATFEWLVVQFIHWQILIFAFASVIDLSNDIFSTISLPATNVTFPNATTATPLNPYLFILIPSAIALVLNYKIVLGGLKFLLHLVRLIIYLMIELPSVWIISPAATASAYLKHSYLLSSVVCVLYGLLYVFVACILFWFFTAFLDSQIPEYKILLAYAMFYAVSLLTYALDKVIKSICIRPLWAYQSRRR